MHAGDRESKRQLQQLQQAATAQSKAQLKLKTAQVQRSRLFLCTLSRETLERLCSRVTLMQAVPKASSLRLLFVVDSSASVCTPTKWTKYVLPSCALLQRQVDPSQCQIVLYNEQQAVRVRMHSLFSLCTEDMDV